MKTKLWSLSTLAALLLMVGVSVYAQQSAPSTTPTDPATAPQTQPNDPTAQQPAASQAQPTTSTSDSQTFTGTIVKSGDKYMLQDAASGKSYDIDHQDQVKQYEGKKVRVHGTLDANGKMIHVQ
ncbi:MAG: DUF5818 domain-containing protein [Candidatus Sulfotelmatobacter sp.]